MQNIRTHLRKIMRQKRQDLSSTDQTLAANQALHQIKQFTPLQQADQIAIYISTNGELNTQPIIEHCWEEGKHVCLPVLHPFSKGQLLFLNYTPDTPMVANKYGIKEPRLDVTQVIPISQLDVIFTPLVAFDSQGQRLGMGGGYYDRSLEPWYTSGKGALPVGLAHTCQQVDRLPVEQWDIPLPNIITPDRIWRWEIEH